MALGSGIHPIPVDIGPDGSPLTLGDIATELGHSLPVALDDLLGPTGASLTFEEAVRIKVAERNPMTDREGRQLVLMLYGLSTGKDGILAKSRAYRGRIAVRCTVLGEDGLGNLFVIDARTGKVKFWHHECPEGEASPTALTLVADDVKAFVSGLEAIAEHRNPDLRRGVKSASFDF